MVADETRIRVVFVIGSETIALVLTAFDAVVAEIKAKEDD